MSRRNAERTRKRKRRRRERRRKPRTKLGMIKKIEKKVKVDRVMNDNSKKGKRKG